MAGGEGVTAVELTIREHLRQLARRIRRNGYQWGTEAFMIEREDIADTLDRMAEEVGT